MGKSSSSNIVPLRTPQRADAHRLGYVGRKPAASARDSDSWFTPPEYLDSVRAVLKRIGLDPFTSAIANEIVGARRIFTREHSAFDHPWRVGRDEGVFMNPPYSAGLCARAVNRFIDQYESGNFRRGIVLVNNATDTRWFSALLDRCSAICFTDHRISFWNADRKHVSGNTRGQAFLYFGNDVHDFTRVFKKHGVVLRPAHKGS